MPFKTLFDRINYQHLEQQEKYNKYTFIEYDYVIDLIFSDDKSGNKIPVPIINNEVATVAKDFQTQSIEYSYSNVIEASHFTLYSGLDN